MSVTATMVPPTATFTARCLEIPNRMTVGYVIRVCDAYIEAISTDAGRMYPNTQWFIATPAAIGMRNESRP